MICKIIEDEYTFEQIESIEAIQNLEKKYNLKISIEDKMYPYFYPEIGLQTSYKVYKNDKLIAFSGFHFYFYDIEKLTPFDIVKICKFKIKHFPQQYKIDLDLLKFGDIGTIWYLIENKWNSFFTTESKKFYLHQEAFEEIFLSQKIGESGYIYVLNSKAVLQVHPEIKGKDVSDVYFVKKQITQKDGYLEYMWKNTREKEEKSKALYMIYFKEWDYIGFNNKTFK